MQHRTENLRRSGMSMTICTMCTIASLAVSLAGQARMLEDINRSGHSNPSSFATIGSNVYFAAGGTLWKTTGTRAVRVSANLRSPRDFTRIGSRIVFSAADRRGGNRELWISDGTDRGTRMLKDIWPGSLRGSEPRDLVAAGNRVVFSANDGRHGYEPWVTDGTSSGTKLLSDIFPGPTGSEPADLVEYRGRVLFAATHHLVGRELHMTNGSFTGTRIIRDIRAGSKSSRPEHLSVFKDQVFFKATGSDNVRGMYRSNTLFSGTKFFAKVLPMGPLVIGDGHAYFRGYDGPGGVELWQTDGTTQGTRRLKDIEPGRSSSSPYDLVFDRNKLYFSAHTRKYGRELWVTKGTPQSTVLVQDIRPGSESGINAGSATLRLLAGIGDGRIVFAGTDASGDTELWLSNGVGDGTYRVQEINPNGSAKVSGLYRHNSYVLMSADDGAHGNEPFTARISTICCGSFFEYGDGCTGTGHFASQCMTNNGRGGALASTQARQKQIEAIASPASPLPRRIWGYELYTHSLLSGAADLTATLHLESPSGKPDVTAVATTTMRVEKFVGFHRAVFTPPVFVPARTGFFITFDRDLARAPLLTSGVRRSSYLRGHRDGFWLQRPSSPWSYRILCQSPRTTAPYLGGVGPQVNERFVPRLSGAPPRSMSLFLIGATNRTLGAISLPLDLAPLGASGCQLRTSADVFVAVPTDSLGLAELSIPIPSSHSVIGGELFVQSLVFDGKANAAGYVVSNARKAVIGY